MKNVKHYTIILRNSEKNEKYIRSYTTNIVKFMSLTVGTKLFIYHPVVPCHVLYVDLISNMLLKRNFNCHIVQISKHYAWHINNHLIYE